MLKRAWALKVFVAATAIAALAVAALAVASAGNPASFYSVLRKNARPSDRLSPEARQLASHVPASYHLRLKDSRRTRQKAGHGVWLVPGRSALCMFVQNHDGGTADTCNKLSAARHGALSILNERRNRSLRLLTAGLPDDTTNVVLNGEGGRTRALDISRNTVQVHMSKHGAASFRPKSVSFDVGGKPYFIPIHRPH
ncbi:MAG: hypothetical protein QOJ01_2304 [Solirubrobacterales bacterium]|nr:hypothetical protein [Solirubrobacterales bacterium]